MKVECSLLAVVFGHKSQRKTAERTIGLTEALEECELCSLKLRLENWQRAWVQYRPRVGQGILTAHFTEAPLKELCCAKEQNRASGME